VIAASTSATLIKSASRSTGTTRPSFGRNRDTNVLITVIDHVVTVNGGIDLGEALQRLAGTLSQTKPMKPEAGAVVRFLELISVLLSARLHQRRHVDLVERS